MKRVKVEAKTTVSTYRNKRNGNKFIEKHEDGYGHRSLKQYMKWDRDDGEVIKNPTGDGNLHRWRKQNADELLEDYEEVDPVEGSASLGQYVGSRMQNWTVSLLAYGAEESPDFEYEQTFTGSLQECLDKLEEYQNIIDDNGVDGYLTLEGDRGGYFQGDRYVIIDQLEEAGII